MLWFQTPPLSPPARGSHGLLFIFYNHSFASFRFILFAMQAIDRVVRTATTDDDASDHIGYDTPRSGVATPQPDPQDKRLPGIMTYYGQVRQDPSTSEADASPSQSEKVTPPDEKQDSQRKSSSSSTLQSQAPAERALPDSDSPAENGSVLENGGPGTSPIAVREELRAEHPYPTPPASQPPSRKTTVHEDEGRAAGEVSATATVPKASSLSQPTTARPHSPDITSQAPSAPARTNPSTPALNGASQSTESQSSDHASDPLEPTTTQSSNKWYSLDGLKGLTRGVMFKSGPPTPTRALSVAGPSSTEGGATSSRTSNDSAEATGTHTPRGPSGAQAPAPKGKLTIKIAEARGLRNCRDPYVVVVFQRNELISSGPRPAEENDTSMPAPAVVGSIPIQRQGSDSGRPPMAIPMRSRQSSNTSMSEHSTFRNRSARLSFTNPKWDAEAVL